MKTIFGFLLLCTGCGLSHEAHPPDDDAQPDSIIVAVYDAQPDRGTAFVYDGHIDDDAATDPDVVTVDPDVATAPDTIVADDVPEVDVALEDAQADVVVDSQPDVPMSHVYQVMTCNPLTNRTVACSTGGCCPTYEMCGSNVAGAPRCCTLCSGFYPPTGGHCTLGTVVEGSDGYSYECGD